MRLRLCTHSFVSQEDEGGLVNNRVNKLKWMLKHTVSDPHLFQQYCAPLHCFGIPTLSSSLPSLFVHVRCGGRAKRGFMSW